MDIDKGLAAIAKEFRRSLPVIVHILSDYEGRYTHHKNLLLFRTSIRKSLRRQNEWPLPYLWESLDESFFPLDSRELPVIGFCGLVTPNREQLLSAFEKSPLCNAKFIKRNEFWAGKPHDPAVMQEFWENMQQCQFMIAQRGAGNFSMRFYQALSAGRIPVLTNTDLLLPFSELINWKEIIVLEESPDACLQRVLDIHRAGKTEAMQELCVQIFNTYFSNGNFWKLTLQQLSVFGNKTNLNVWERFKMRFSFGKSND
jgi:hypothetical protein